MRFQNVKPEELDGPIKLQGFQEWARSLTSGPGVTSLLLVAPSGTGKGAAIGQLAEALRYEVVRCRMKQLLDYPDPAREFRALLAGGEHMRRTVIWLDGLDRMLHHMRSGENGSGQEFTDWLQRERNCLRENEVIVAATAQGQADVPETLSSAFDRCFTA